MPFFTKADQKSKLSSFIVMLNEVETSVLQCERFLTLFEMKP